jgi:N-acetylmuramoyl-L-alanine amidase
LLPRLVVLHHTAMMTADAALDRLCDPASDVSCHYVIGRDGTVWQLVDEELRAWHAGTGSWGGAGDVNSRSIGIELDNAGPLNCCPPFPAPQMTALEALLSGILTRHDIPAQGVIAHSDMAPDRKADPGAAFDWRRLARRDLSVWPSPGGGGVDRADPKAFVNAAVRFGYGLPAGEDGFDILLAAFRLRFRPGRAGPLDVTDMALITDLATRFPVDPAPDAA